MDETDLLILVALALGKSQDDAGRFAIDPEHPEGISGRSVRNRLKAGGDAYDRLLPRITAEITREREVACAEVREISKQEYSKALGKLRAKGVKVKELALDSALTQPYNPEALTLGVAVADGIENRDFGKPTQKVAHEVGGRVDHVIWNRPVEIRKLAREEIDMMDSEQLVQLLPPAAIEAEVVE